MSHNAQIYEENKKEFKKKYQKSHPQVYDYCATWFDGPWCNWQIFRNRPGQANSNSNIESFNNVIKLDLNRKRLPMKAAILAIFEQIVYYSTEDKIFEKIPKFNRHTRELADSLIKSNFKQIRKDRIIFTNTFNGKKSKYTLTINDSKYLNNCSCECKYFVKHAVCMHLVAYSNLFNIDLFDSRYSKPLKNINFVKKNKRGAKKGGREKYGKALDKEADVVKNNVVKKTKILSKKKTK